MGTDYSSGSAIIVDLDGMLSLINGKNKKAVLEVIQSFADKEMESEYIDDNTKDSLKRLDNIPTNINLVDLRGLLEDFHEISGSAGKYSGDCHFTNGMDSYELMELWESIIEVSGVGLPDLNSIRIFDGYRPHMDCPMEEVSFCFDVEGCYEKTLNQEGENLSGIASNMYEISWTDVSY